MESSSSVSMCFECLERRIESDFSGGVTFTHGVSSDHSPLPFGSQAVVQVSSRQYLLNYVPYRPHDCCFAKYVDEYCAVGDDIEFSNVKQAPGIPSARVDTAPTEFARNTCFNCEACTVSSHFSCSRAITSLAPTAYIGNASFKLFEELASSFLTGSLEDHILRSLNQLLQGKSTLQESCNFLSLVGLPSFKEKGFPGCIRHPNIVPVLGMLRSSNHISTVLPNTTYTLENILRYSPAALESDWHVRLLIYQILSALVYMHGLGIAHGNLTPSSIMLTDTSWCWLQVGAEQLVESKENSTEECRDLSPGGFCFEGCSSRALYSDLNVSLSGDWQSSFNSWWKGELSNFEYLLILNKLAGRRWGDHTFHMVMPWVVDFSVKPDENNNVGWRDLSKSKWRLAKGDEQLDFTYSTSEIAHHVSDECLSELAVCSYKARRLPLSVLRAAVRAVYEPNEYPANMQRLYQWTPDECIPEFYCDPRIFYSVHPGMPDLAVPSWAHTPEEFIQLHRDALESERVSYQIHHWIDITFGYKMSGDAAIAAKNVMLPTSTSVMPQSIGRRQLFTQPHPPRHTVRRVASERNIGSAKVAKTEGKHHLLGETNFLNELETATSFCENLWYLTPCYNFDLKGYEKAFLGDNSDIISSKEPENFMSASAIGLNYILENIQVKDDSSTGYQEMLLWEQKSHSKASSKKIADDIFAIGCVLAELHLKKPLFGMNSLVSYLESGVLPSHVKELPHHMQVIVKTCIQKDWNMRPSAKCLLESPYFPESIKSSYLFLASFHLLAKHESRLQYAATFANLGALRKIGDLGAEMCAPYCLPLVVTSASDTEAEWAYILLTEFLKCLKLEAVKKRLVPAIQKILQAAGHSHLKVSLLQGSFMQEIWRRIGKQDYIEKIHPLIISNLFVASHKSSAAAASVLLIGSSEEFGVPITVHQTVLPLILCFGKGLCNDGADTLIRIGGLFGENFVVKQIMPLLQNVIHSCIYSSTTSRPEPIQSWGSLALIDCLTTIDGLLPVLTNEKIVKELIEDGSFPFVKILLHKDMAHPVLQNTAKSLIRVCQKIGPDLTALHVLPKLKELFDELAFSQEKNNYSTLLGGSQRGSSVKEGEENIIGSRMDMALLLYPQFASLLGIEKLRHCCATWLILEQFLLRHHNWKWESAGGSSQSNLDSLSGRKSNHNKGSTYDNTHSKHLLNGVGWSRPQLRGKKGAKNFLPNRGISDYHQIERQGTISNSAMQEPWYWFPSPPGNWSEHDLAARAGSPKEELPWKIRASIVQSVRAHHGALRSIAVCPDECTVFTAGVGPGFKGNIQKWELSRVDCLSSYNGHEEVVNDIHVLASSGRVASCDGTLHIWNGQSGQPISLFSESSLASTQLMGRDEDNMLHFNPLSNGMLSTPFHGNSYTTMDHLEFADRLVVGTGSGSLRFIDVNQGQKLHLWRSEYTDSGYPALISSICSFGSSKVFANETVVNPSWIAAAFSTGYCRLYDIRSGKIIAAWQAHEGYVTKLAAASDHLLVSSSLDKTLRIWDLRRNWTAEHTVFRGYSDGVSGFSVRGQNVISICKNKIGLSSLHSSADEDGQYRAAPQHLYMVDGESKNLSVLSAISILPYSRLFLVGTEDGHLTICC